MIEDSPEQFVRQWGEYASEVEIFPHIENTPLFEVRLETGKIIHLFDRTGPYTVKPGPEEVLINPMISEFSLSDEDPVVEEHRRGHLRAVGTVEQVDGKTFGFRSGPVLLAVSVIGDTLPNVGDTIAFSSLPGVHAFIVQKFIRRFGTHRPAE